MKISKETQSIMRSFIGINTGMVIPVGNIIQTESEPKDQFAKCTVSENFTTEFAVYDLATFLKMLEQFEDAELTFEKDYVNIKQGRSQVDFYYTDKSFITHGDFLDIKDDQYVVSFDLSADDISEIQKVSGALTLDQMKFANHDGKLECEVISNAEDTNNRYRLDMGECNIKNDFEFIMRVGENFRFYTDDYEIKIAKIGDVLVFCANAKNRELNYQVALDRKSYYTN